MCVCVCVCVCVCMYIYIHGGVVFTDSGFWKYSWAHLVMSMTESCRWVMQCRLRARRPRASNKGLRPCPLRTEISPVSLNLLMMFFFHCRWWDLQSLCNLMLRNFVFKVFHNLFTHSFTDWRASAHLYFWEAEASLKPYSSESRMSVFFSHHPRKNPRPNYLLNFDKHQGCVVI